jgi:type I restriction enzyme S subunit
MIEQTKFCKETDFHDSIVGRLPNEWQITKLEDVVEIRDSKRVPLSEMERRDRKGSYPYCGANGIIDYIDDYIFDGEYVLLAEDGGSYGRFESSAYVMRGKFWVNNHAHILQAIGRKTSNQFLKLVLDFLDLNLYVVGSTRKKLNQERMREIIIPFPSIGEQRAIVRVLGVVDLAIAKTGEVIAKTERLKKGLMQELLTKGIGHKEYKQTPIGKIPKTWNVVKLQQMATVRYGLGQPPELEDNGVPMIRATNIKRGSIIETGLLRVKRSAVPSSRDPYLRAGDVIVVRSGAYTGDIGYVSKKWEGAVAGYDLVVSPSSNLDSIFLTHYLLSTKAQVYFSQLKSRSAQPHLNSEQVSETPIPLPPLHEQQRIASVLSKVDEKLDLENALKKRLERIKRGLMDLLLTGKVRVKV